MKTLIALVVFLFAATADACPTVSVRVLAPLPTVVYAPVIGPRVHKERHVYKPRGERHVVKVKY